MPVQFSIGPELSPAERLGTSASRAFGAGRLTQILDRWWFVVGSAAESAECWRRHLMLIVSDNELPFRTFSAQTVHPRSLDWGFALHACGAGKLVFDTSCKTGWVKFTWHYARCRFAGFPKGDCVLRCSVGPNHDCATSKRDARLEVALDRATGRRSAH
jgi:hypothetical protein